MSLITSPKINLRQQPNSRERIIFLVALFAFAVGFYKAFVVESTKSVTALQQDLDKAKTEQEKLSQKPSTTAPNEGIPEARAAASKLNWIGNKSLMNSSSDALIQAAQENGITLVRFSIAEQKEKQNYLAKPVSLTVTGNLKELGRYLETSERLEIPFVIDRLVLSPNAQFADLVTLIIDGGFYANK